MIATSATPAAHPCLLPRPGLERARVQVLLILALCLLDGLLTLQVLARGSAVEWNPLMAALLARGPGVFLGVKLLGTLVGCGILLALVRRRIARQGLLLLLAAYICLTSYHLAGQLRIGA